jgi:hypothetical protein
MDDEKYEDRVPRTMTDAFIYANYRYVQAASGSDEEAEWWATRELYAAALNNTQH